MDLRDNNQLPRASPDLARQNEPQSCRLLDLPAEIRFMIYGYAVGYHNVCWTVKRHTKGDYLLVLGDEHDINPRRCPVSLLRSCRLILREAHPILYNQTRFDVRYRFASVDLSRYQLRITPYWKDEHVPSMAKVVLSCVRHIRVAFDSTGSSILFWKFYLLRRYLDYGRRLKSLRLAFSGKNPLEALSDVTYSEDFPYLESYHGNAIFDFCDSEFTDEAIASTKERLKASGQQLSITIIKKTDLPSHKKDWWAKLAH